MCSSWTGATEGAFFDGEKFDRNRIINQVEKEYSNRSSKDAYYVLAVDVGRKGCQTVIIIMKVTPSAIGDSIKSIVNMVAIEDTHFED